MNKKMIVSAAMMATLAVAGCAAPPAETSVGASASGSTGAKGGTFKACMVSDAGGFDDKSFNETSHKGLLKAKADLNIPTAEIESKDEKDYATNLKSMVDANCTMIVSVGFKLGEATVAAAKGNPNVNFAIVDHNTEAMASVKNLKPLMFNTAQSSFLAGYTAAAMSKTGKVGTFGGMNIPTVTVFMEGFTDGIKYFNKEKSKNVQLIGWDTANPKSGMFVPEPNPFSNVAGGKQTAATLKAQGADILFPVAGGAGEGALQVAAESEGKVSVIWVDSDGFESQAKYAKYILTSVYKGMDVAVLDAIKAAKDGKFESKPYVGTLENKGSGISPFHDFDAQVPAEVKSDLDKIRADIVSGKLKVESPSQPK